MRCLWSIVLSQKRICPASATSSVCTAASISLQQEFVIGATLVAWGCSAKSIILGLIIGNILAMLSFTFCCATLGTSTRLTLYSYLKKILGPHAQKVYNLVWSLCSITLAASGICVSSTAIRETADIPIQHEWYPTHIGFPIIVVILGIIVTIVAANGFDACAKFSSTCVPWMIAIFFVGAVVALPQIAQATGVEINSFANIWNIFNSNVGSGNPNAEPYTIAHVACFAWLCNLAWHMGCNDMGLFRFAKNYKYGYITAIGMFVGHFFAWVTVAIMGATAATVLRTSLSVLDPGAVTNTVFGMTGICAVVVAGWTTANPTIYRSALALNTLMPKLSHKQVTYIVGALMTILACFPGMTNIGDIVSILGWAVVGVGAICIVEHYLFPKIGYTRFWSMYKEQAEYAAFEQALKDLVDRDAEAALAAGENKPVKNAGFTTVLSVIAYIVLAGIVVIALMTYMGSMTVVTFKSIAFILTICYFVLNGISTFIKYRNEAVVRQ